MQAMTQKSKNLLTAALVAALSVSVPPAARATVKPSPTKAAEAELPQLQLTVDVPPNWRPFLADDLAEAFASRVSDVFRRRGYTGKVVFVELNNLRPDVPVLAIRLINWRLDRTDNAQCTFSASLNQGKNEQTLGLFDNTSLTWDRGMSRWGLAEALGDVADSALRDLSVHLAQTGLIPGFPAAKK